jgi:hypothetical protein
MKSMESKGGKMHRRAKIVLFAFAGALIVLTFLLWGSPQNNVVKATRELLREEGFKTELSDFDFSIPPEVRTRSAVLTNPSQSGFGLEARLPEIMNLAGSNSAVVAWRNFPLLDRDPLSVPEAGNGEINPWGTLRHQLDEEQKALNAIVAAAVSGPTFGSWEVAKSIRLCARIFQRGEESPPYFVE